jgi:bacillolysin
VPGAAFARVTEPELVIYALDEAAPRLAWKMDVEVSASQRWLVAIDAVDGGTLAAFNQVADAKAQGSGTDLFGTKRALNVWNAGGAYYMVDTSKKMFDPSTDPLNLDSLKGGIVIMDANHKEQDNQGGVDLLYVKSQSPSAWSLPDAVSASFGLSKTYDYYLARHQRNSLDGKGGTMLGVVRYAQDLQNAFWNGSFMAFGDAQAYAGALDVVGHELAHGVTQHTAGLVYKDQSGALNEAFSDIFGESVENYANGALDWKLGETLGKPLRDMKDPSSMAISGSYRYPAKMSQFYGPGSPLLALFQGQDNGGVHINSSIINHAYYLLAEGLAGAVGKASAEKIFYRALSNHLVTNSQFVDARLACVQSAEELFGANSAQAKKTAEAFDAVEISEDTGTPQQPPSRPPVQGQDAALFVFADPFFGLPYIGRREGNDPSSGVFLSTVMASIKRPVVTGDGALAYFVGADNDLYSAPTDKSRAAEAWGYPGTVHSVALTPDGNRWAFVLLDFFGFPTHEINVYDVKADQLKTYALVAPATDGADGGLVDHADSMAFSGDGKTLVYDALTYIRQPNGGSIPVWSLYALDLQREIFTSLLPPIPGVSVGNPAFGKTSDSLLTFEASDDATGVSVAFTASLVTGQVENIGQTNQCCAYPDYSGDDSAIVYSQSNPFQNTGYSLLRQPLGADKLAASGSASVWLEDGYAGVVYRRGSFKAPAANVFASPTALSFGTAKGAKSKVTFKNAGTADAALGKAVLSPSTAPFAITKDTCAGLNLLPSAKCTVELTFAGGSGLKGGFLKLPLADTGKSLQAALSGGIKIQVATSTLNFNLGAANSDSFSLAGKLSGATAVNPSAITSVKFALGGFSQAITNLVRGTGQVTFSSAKAGITSLVVDLTKGSFSVKGSKLSLSQLPNPPSVSLTLNSTKDCAKPKYTATASKWTFDAALGQKQSSCTALY